MKDKGFTLIEVLAILAILAIIAVTTMPIVTRILSKGSERSTEIQIKTIEKAANDYVLLNLKDVDFNESSNNPGVAFVSVAKLKESELLEKNEIINPNTKEEMTGCVYIKEKTTNEYSTTYVEKSCSELIQGGSL